MRSENVPCYSANMKFILTRHGETDKNVEGRVYGTLPSKLTANGRTQAERLAVALRDQDISAIYCSDLDRCVETARPIAAFHPSCPVHYTELLREQDQTTILGMLVKKVDWQHLPNGVETPAQMTARSEIFLSQLDMTSPQTVLIVSHRRFLNTFVNVLLGQGPAYEAPEQLVNNSSLTVIECTQLGNGKVLQANDVMHLK